MRILGSSRKASEKGMRIIEREDALLTSLAEIHNRLGELVMIMQMIALSGMEATQIDPQDMEKILKSSRTISMGNDAMRSDTLKLIEEK